MRLENLALYGISTRLSRYVCSSTIAFNAAASFNSLQPWNACLWSQVPGNELAYSPSPSKYEPLDVENTHNSWRLVALAELAHDASIYTSSTCAVGLSVGRTNSLTLHCYVQKFGETV